jgi:uncharacterized protein YecE (DUF72 family)
VAADPAPAVHADVPAGWPGIVYFRLHGSPRKYWSKYDVLFMERLAERLRASPRCAAVWCVFDNTASGAAPENAAELNILLRA